MKTWFFIGLVAIFLLTISCGSTFLVYKEGIGGAFLGSRSKPTYDLLCGSGDLDKVLADTHLEPAMKNAIYKYSCAKTERSAEMIKQIYASMTIEQRKDIKSAFRKNGYAINKFAC
jgi:hypothetical protein